MRNKNLNSSIIKLFLITLLVIDGFIMVFSGLSTVLGFTIGPMDANYEPSDPFKFLATFIFSVYAFFKLKAYYKSTKQP
jgi:hypothetical protein